MELGSLMRMAGEAGAIDIALGIPEEPPPEDAVSAATAALAAGLHQYGPPAGLPELRAAVARLAGPARNWALDPEAEVTITCGATEAIMVALLTVTDPGDEVLVIEPFFELYPGMVTIAGAIPKPVRLTGPDWRLDLDAVRAALTPRSRAVLLNTPHNPTGRVFDDAELTGLLRLCAEHDLVLITDEVYEHFVYKGLHSSPAADPAHRARTIVVGSLSKSFRMTGWRIGYCLAEPGLTEGLRRVHERTTVGASHPLQRGAAVLSQRHLADRESLRSMRDEMAARLTGLGFEVSLPEGGWFALAHIGGLAAGSTRLAHRLVREAGVLVAPGSAFFADRADGEEWIRVTFARDPAATREALTRMERLFGR
ncbi:hypothetical protein ALI22I_17605 [Saccharothrix sp. ALI-22-I]|nr:hypothetical protein ALI22I_17605 [Saccharothrix sp. ALI-22-I]